ncbi:MAG: thermonuclease family protein [Oscillospiraceae bacterium]|nr:thermonuclease family protein [Oscillospiraceae bacterium]
MLANLKRSVALLLLLSLVLCLFGCTEQQPQETTAAPTEQTQPPEVIDYASSVKLDMESATAKQEVTVKLFIDGDTTHFYVPATVMSNGVLKARYMAVDTPESTGKIEEYGKKAAKFTREKLESASSIVIESETAFWTADSTGSRFMAWVWYKTPDMTDYRNLNIELLQNGLAIASNAGGNQYGETCLAAIDQAKREKLNIHSGEKDPDFYYGEAVELTLRELRTNTETYSGMKVAFEGVITTNDNNSVYVEGYDPETDMYCGMAVYYGFNLNGKGLEILSVGNEVRIVGSLQYYEAGGTYQVSDLKYQIMRPTAADNIQCLSEGNAPAFVLTDAETFTNGQVTFTAEDGSTVTKPYAEMALNSSIEMKGLKVRSIYTTKNEDSASKGAMTLTCEVDGKTISVRTVVLRDAEGNLITADAYQGKTIDVKGLVDYYNGTYQIKVFSPDNITVVE